MPIVSDKDYVFGKPRIEGTRIWVSHVVEGTEQSGLQGYLTDFPDLTEEQVKEALDYCRNQKCVGNVVKYCLYCSKDTSPPVKDAPEKGVHVLGNVSLEQALREWSAEGKILCIGSEDDFNRKRDLWKVAAQLIEKYVGKKSEPQPVKNQGF